VQGRGTPIRNRKDQAEAQQGGIDGERTKRKLAIGNRKEGRLSESEVQQEVERLFAYFLTARKNGLIKSKEKVGEAELKNQPTIKEMEEVVGEAAELPTIRETPPQDTKAAAAKEQLRATGGIKALESGLKNGTFYDTLAVEAQTFRRNWKGIWTGKFGSYEDISKPFFRLAPR
jgi:hypothetical protein